METVLSGITNGLQQQAQGGNIGGLLSTIMGQGGSLSASNPMVNGMISNVVGNLMGKLGVSETVAKSIAAAVIPMVLSKLFAKATDPNDSSIDVGSIMGAATGNQNAGNVDWMGMASTAMADGKLDMSDVMRVAGGLMGGSNTGGGQQSGGLGGLLGGLFGGK